MKINIGKIKKLLIFGVVIFLFPRCTKFLETQDKSNYTADNYFKTPAQAESSVNAIYQSLSVIYGGTQGFAGGSAPWLMLEFQTGLANTEFGDSFDNLAVRNLTNSSDNAQGLIWWNESYKGITNANLAIAKIPGIAMGDVQKNTLLGQARFLRAFFYYNLVRIFGKVPLITSPVDLNSPDFYPMQASESDIYKLIVEDLTFAETSGLPLTDMSGRVSLGAVKSFLASVYLTMAGHPLQLGNDYFKKAADKAAEVIQSGQYSLFNSYNNLHDPAFDNKGENIFEVQFTALVQPSGWQGAIVPYYKGISAYTGQSGAIFAELPFVNSFETGDKRTQEKEFFYTKYTLHANRNTTIDLGNHYIYKLFDSVAQNSTASSGLNWTLMRYAEILLIYAEASNEVSGPTVDAFEAVNKIRRRAMLPELSGLSKDQFREAIWRESFHEMCYEDKNWFTMVRIRKGYNVTTNGFDDYVGHKFSYGPVLKQRELLFPVPTSAIQTNKNLKQNPDY